jgi:hypothetical protein
MNLRLAAASAALVALNAVGAAGANAATLTPTAACYPIPVGGMATVTLTAAGLTPGDNVEMTNGSTTNVFGNLGPLDLFAHTNADPNGNATFSTTTNAGTIDPAIGTVVASVNDEDTGTNNVASATITLASATFTIGNDNLVSPTKKVAWVIVGLPGVTTVYAHSVQPRTHRVFTVRLGTASGPCGLLKAKAVALPVPRGQVKAGTWSIQVDGKARYSPSTTPRLVNGFRIERFVG